MVDKPLNQTNQFLYHKCDTRAIFMQSTVSLNSMISFCSTGCLIKVKHPSHLFYLSIVVGRTDGFMPFSRALVLSETQTHLISRTWNMSTVSSVEE